MSFNSDVRNTFRDLLNLVATLETDNPTIDTLGAVQENLTITEQFPCALEQLSAEEQAVRGQLGVISTHRMWCVPVPKMNEKQVVWIGTGGANGLGDRYEITGLTDVQGRGLNMEVTLRKIVDGGTGY